MTEHFFAPCPRGLEAALAAELGALGAAEITTTDGGAAFAGPIELAYRANLESRLASRMLWRVGQGAYRDENDVYELAKALDWPRWFRADRTLRVDVAATRSPLTSLEFATLRIKDAVCDRHRAAGGVRPSISKDRPDVRVHAYLTATDASFYLDTSGEPLFKRGYRRETADAPLRENLAAGLLRLAGWQPGTPLLDPMCGSGTIADRGGADRAGHRAGTQADVRLPEARLVRRSGVAANQAGGAAPRQAAGAGGHLGERQRRDGDPPMQRQHRRGGRRRHGIGRAGRRADAPAPAAAAADRQQSAVRRAPRRLGCAGRVLSAARRRAQAAIRRLDGLPAERATRGCRN